MGVLKTKEEFIKRVSDYVGDNARDEDIEFIDDMVDTYNSISEGGSQAEIEKLKRELVELDQKWKDKYRQRFSKGEASTYVFKDTKEYKDDEPDEDEILVDDLFEKGGK